MRSIRRLDDFPSMPVICGSSLPIPFRLFNHDMRLPPPHQSPRLPYRFSVPPHRIALFDPPCRTTIRFSGTRRPPPFSSRSLHDWRGDKRLPLFFPLPYPSNRLLAFLLASLSAGRLGVSPTIRFPIRPAGRMRVFRARIRFPVDFAVTCDTLNRYTCGRGGTADTPDLGSGGEIRVGSNPTARTTATYSPPPQPVQVAAGAGFFHAAETKIQSIRFRYERNGRAASGT